MTFAEYFITSIQCFDILLNIVVVGKEGSLYEMLLSETSLTQRGQPLVVKGLLEPCSLFCLSDSAVAIVGLQEEKQCKACFVSEHDLKYSSVHVVLLNLFVFVLHSDILASNCSPFSARLTCKLRPFLASIPFTFRLGFVHPLQDVALHQCLPSSSVRCFLVPGGSPLPSYVILPSFV